MILQAIKGRQLRHNVEWALAAGRRQYLPRSRQRWAHERKTIKARNERARNPENKIKRATKGQKTTTFNHTQS